MSLLNSGPTLKRRWANVSYLLGMPDMSDADGRHLTEAAYIRSANHNIHTNLPLIFWWLLLPPAMKGVSDSAGSVIHLHLQNAQPRGSDNISLQFVVNVRNLLEQKTLCGKIQVGNVIFFFHL